ncbi:hypothetical protein ACFL04_04645 [Patescibacteria group bacterium]
MILQLAQADTTETTSSVSSFLSNIDWATPTWDLFIILFFIVAAFVYGLSLGRDRIIAILVSVYMALAVVNAAPFLSNNDTVNTVSNFFLLPLSTFIGLLILLFFLLSRSALLATVASSDEKGSWWQVLLFSFLHVGLIISVILSLLPVSFIEALSPLTQNIFASETAKFLWIALPIVAMLLIRGGASDKKKYKYDV